MKAGELYAHKSRLRTLHPRSARVRFDTSQESYNSASIWHIWLKKFGTSLLGTRRGTLYSRSIWIKYTRLLTMFELIIFVTSKRSTFQPSVGKVYRFFSVSREIAIYIRIYASPPFGDKSPHIITPFLSEILLIGKLASSLPCKIHHGKSLPTSS